MTDEASTIEILTARRGEAVQRLQKLAKKALKYGNEPITWSFGEPFMGVEETRYGRVKVEKVTLTVTGGAVRVGSHRFLAKIEHTSHGNIVDTPPAIEGRPEWRTAPSRCEHCNTDRLRKETFMVAEPGGAVVQVGRTCLRDYLGTDSPETVISAMRWLKDFRDLSETLSGGGSVFFTQHVVLAAVVGVRLHGFVPKSAPESAGRPTAFYVSNIVGFSTSKQAVADREEFRNAVTDADRARAEKVLAFARAGASHENDYRHNLAIACAGDTMDPKRLGIVASAPGALEREEGFAADRRAREEEKRKTATTIRHLGTLGQRRVFEGEVFFVKTIDGHFGPSRLIKVHTADGGMVVMFTTAEDAWELEAGDKVKMRATIDAHSEFDGTKETKVKRPFFLPFEEKLVA